MKKKILILNLALSIITYGKLNTGDTFKLWENIAPGSEKVERSSYNRRSFRKK